jgi:hypothetical protein
MYVNIVFPFGIVVIIDVITVAPHNDIWPNGNTYPKKAVAIINMYIIIPVVYTLILFVYIIALIMCKFAIMKKYDAVFECIYLINHPFVTFLCICTIELNGSVGV